MVSLLQDGMQPYHISLTLENVRFQPIQKIKERKESKESTLKLPQPAQTASLKPPRAEN